MDFLGFLYGLRFFWLGGGRRRAGYFGVGMAELQRGLLNVFFLSFACGRGWCSIFVEECLGDGLSILSRFLCVDSGFRAYSDY